MGIPGYFAQAIKNVPNAVNTKGPVVARLFLDFNSAVHRGVSETATTESVIDQACQTLSEIVDIVRPTESIFVAIDGVAPLAKVNQQRSRRYLSQKMKACTNVATDNDVPSKRKNEPFDRNAITPGTKFMTKLCDRLKQQSQTIAAEKGIKAIFSGSSVFGEGEHKIVDHIRRNPRETADEIYAATDCIYGLDADLIILSMVLVAQTGQAPFIVRERTTPRMKTSEETPDGVQAYEFLDVTALIDDIIERGAESLSKQQKIMNHVVASFLVGNDFLPPLSYLSIKHGGLEDVLGMCTSPLCSETGYLIEWDALSEVLKELADKEDPEFTKKDERYWATKPPSTEDPVMLWDNYPIVNKDYKLKHIAPSRPGWVPRYYDSLFSTKDVSGIVKSYVVGLQWTLDYYTGKYSKNTPCWQYIHAYAPTAIDVHNFVSANPEISGMMTTDLRDRKIYEYDPGVALLMVTPPSSFDILSPRLKELATDINSGIAHIFPEDFKIHTYLKRWVHECKANVPPVDIEIIQQIYTQNTTA